MCPAGSPDSCNSQTIVKAFGVLLKFLWFEFYFTVRSREITPWSLFQHEILTCPYETDVMLRGVCVIPCQNVMDLLCSKGSSFWVKIHPPTCWNTEQHTPQQQVSPSKAMSPQARADAFLTPDPKHFCDCGTAFLAFSPLSPYPLWGQIYHLPLSGWLYQQHKNSPTERRKCHCCGKCCIKGPGTGIMFVRQILFYLLF